MRELLALCVKAGLGYCLGMFWYGVVGFVLERVVRPEVSPSAAHYIDGLLARGTLRAGIIGLMIGIMVFAVR